MQPYPPPDAAGREVALMLPAPGPAPIPPSSRITSKDAAIIGLSVIGTMLLLTSLSSPWFYFNDRTTEPYDPSVTITIQEHLMGEERTQEQANVETATFILVLVAALGGVSSCCLAGRLAFRRWRSKWAAALIVCLIPVLFSLLAPVYYYYQLPQAKADIRQHFYPYQHDYSQPEGESPEKTFFGSGSNVEYYWNDGGYYEYHTADEAQWGGSVGFYLPFAAMAVFILAYAVMIARIFGAFEEQRKARPA